MPTDKTVHDAVRNSDVCDALSPVFSMDGRYFVCCRYTLMTCPEVRVTDDAAGVDDKHTRLR